MKEHHPPAQRRFYTIPEVGEQLNVSVAQVRALLATGDLEGVQIGGRAQWRIENRKLDEYIDRLYQAQRPPKT